MLKVVDNEVAVYKAEKKLNVLYGRNNQSRMFFKKKPSHLEIEILEGRIEKLKIFHKSNVIVCKYGNYGQFPFQFNDNLRLIMMPYSNGESKIFSYDDVEKVQILPDYEQHELTTTITKRKGGVVRSVIGGTLFGPVGAVVGAATAGSKSSSTTKHYTNFSSYMFCVWLKNEECYYINKIPSKGFFDKKPPNELLELELYFLKIINESNTSRQTQIEEKETYKANEYIELKGINYDDYISNFQLNKSKVERIIMKQRILKGLMYVFISLLCLLLIAAFIAMINGLVEWLNSF